MTKLYPYGKDQVSEPMVELDNGKVVTLLQLMEKLYKKAKEKNVIADSDVV